MIADYNVQKESSLALTPRRGAVAPKSVAPGGETSSAHEDEDEEDGEESEHGDANTLFARATTASSPTVLRTPSLRVQRHTGEREYDGSDGWSVVQDLDVREAQQWYRSKFIGLPWEDWKNGNRLVYFLNRADGAFPTEVASFLSETMGNTAMRR